MSVRTRNYVVYGYMLDYPDDPDDEFHDAGESASTDGVSVISDGMSGEYAAVGHVAARSDEYGQFAQPARLPVDSEALTRWAAQARAAAQALGLTLPHGAVAAWHVFTHYT